MRRTHRGTLLTLGVAIALGAAACSGGAVASGSQNNQKTSAFLAKGAPLRVGVLGAFSGVEAANGQEQIHGWNLYFDQHGDTIEGHKIITSPIDVGITSTAKAVSGARLAYEQDHDQILVGPIASNQAYGAASFVKGKPILNLQCVSSANQLTGTQRLPNVIRVAGWTGSQVTMPLGAKLASAGNKTAITVASDYAFGYENVGGFVKTFTAGGGKILKQYWTPVGTSDYSSILAAIAQAHPQVVFVEEIGTDGVHFMQQWDSQGLSKNIKLYTMGTVPTQANLSALGSDAAGILSVHQFANGSENPATQAFDKAFYSRFHQLPASYAAEPYLAARWLATAMQSLGTGNITLSQLEHALYKVSFSNTIMGPMHLDKYGNPIENVYLRKVEKGPYGLWNVPVYTWHNVSQFWTYSSSQWLAQPDFSKTYQGKSS